MRNLIILPNSNLGGAELILKNLSFHLDQNLAYTFDVIFLLNGRNDGRNDGWSDCNFKNFKLYYLFDLSMIDFLRLLRTLFKVKYHYIFTTHTLITGLVGVLVYFKILKKDYFVGRESTNVFKRFKGIKLLKYKIHYHLGYRQLDLLICQTNKMKSELLLNFPWLAEKCIVILNPIDTKKAKQLSEFHLLTDLNQPYIVAAGRLIELKGFDMLIEAFSIIKEDFPVLNLIILGTGPERINLRSLIDKYKLNSSVFLMGFVENVYPYFKNATICVVSSKIEGFPNVLLQMMSVNSNVVSTNCAGGICEINGLTLVKDISVNGLAQGLLRRLNSKVRINDNMFKEYLENRSIKNYFLKLEKFIKP